MERWPFITEASSPGEGLSQTPAGLGGIVETQRETESVCVLLQHVSVNVFSRWTHTGRRWLTSALSLQPCTHKHAERGTRNNSNFGLFKQVQRKGCIKMNFYFRFLKV